MAVHLAIQTWTLVRMLMGHQHSGPSRTLCSRKITKRLFRNGGTWIGSLFYTDSVYWDVQVLILLGALHQAFVFLGHKQVNTYWKHNSSSLKVRLWPRSWRFPCCWSRTCRRRPAAAPGCRCHPPGMAGTLGSENVNIRTLNVEFSFLWAGFCVLCIVWYVQV